MLQYKLWGNGGHPKSLFISKSWMAIRLIFKVPVRPHGRDLYIYQAYKYDLTICVYGSESFVY